MREIFPLFMSRRTSRANADFFEPQLTLAQENHESAPFTLGDTDVLAITIHAQIDDYRTETASSIGPRIACDVIEPAEAN